MVAFLARFFDKERGHVAQGPVTRVGVDLNHFIGAADRCLPGVYQSDRAGTGSRQLPGEACDPACWNNRYYGLSFRPDPFSIV